ncbi:DUF6055 domain-containing protein [Roseimarinus sediminis]|uniref:DUF6055 domain-containing protein n=1 Tax=Roseimarinus sediminis TaxID=1610899 RepID=UPI003D1AC885
MYFNNSFNRLKALVPALMALFCVSCGPKGHQSAEDVTALKVLYIPDTVYMVPADNNYSADTSEYSYARMKESPSFALFWAKEYGDDPMANPDTIKRFNPDELLEESERIYNYYVDELKFVEKGNSITDKYKMLIYIFGGDGGTAFGGGEDDKVGVFWAPAIRMNKPPYGALAHEMGHLFQYLSDIDKAMNDTLASGRGAGSYSFVEMTSQYMLWQVYPEWMTFENYHLEGFMKQTHLAFLHEKNMYHSPYVLEYWSNKHGKDFIGRIWRENRKGEDPVMTYKRITGIDQQAFNDEIFDAASRFITWDMERVEKLAGRYANQHSCKMIDQGNGWYQIDESRCPQNYGYNGIRLDVPLAGTQIMFVFKGIAGAEGYRAVDVESAGWRYGFLAVSNDGERFYSEALSEPHGAASFVVPDETAYLWFVVTGAPEEHTIHLIDGKDENDEQWPYRIRMAGTAVHYSAL